jgi:hypothetical protein
MYDFLKIWVVKLHLKPIFFISKRPNLKFHFCNLILKLMKGNEKKVNYSVHILFKCVLVYLLS